MNYTKEEKDIWKLLEGEDKEKVKEICSNLFSVMCKKCKIRPREYYGDKLELHGLCTQCFDEVMDELDDKSPTKYGHD